ncbi:MAG: GH116 family glycosyl-hydrolase [Candidatus Latescibacterota bacterium]
MHARLFPTDLEGMKWLEFPAAGFPDQACGVIHRKDTPAANGVPLGGVDTGCLDLETDGTFGYCTVFNSHVPRRGPLNLPFLGLSVHNAKIGWHESWVLSTRKLANEAETRNFMGGYTPRRAAPAEEIHYWGHFPVADLEYDLPDCPLGVGLRAWAPFVPGDVALSNTPGALFEVRLRNTTEQEQKGTLVFSFPGPSVAESAGHAHYQRIAARGAFAGVVVSNGYDQEYALGIANRGESFRTGGDLGADGGYWSNIGAKAALSQPYPGLPQELGQAGAAVGVDFALAGGEEKAVTFVLAWYSPKWQGGGGPLYGGNTYYHKYAERYRGAYEVADFLATHHERILARILAWQQVLYTEETLPVWLRESLVNILHLIPEDSFWAQARPPIGEWCRPQDGLFGLNECPRGCPQIECIPCSFYGNIPVVYFFPELALSTLRGYKAYQYPAGNAPWIFGGITGACATPPCEMAMPSPGYRHKPQTTLDGPCYVDMVERVWLRTGDRAVLEEFYDSVKRNTVFTMGLRPEAGPAGIVSIPTGNNAQDWMESCELFGIVPHIGGAHLANLRMAARMARQVGDTVFAQQCEEWFRQGSQVLEEQTWQGEYYLLYHEPETGKKSDVVMGCQLDGQWMTRFHGLEGAFPAERVRTTLDTLMRTNVYPHGATVFRIPREGELNEPLRGSSTSLFLPGYWGEAGVHFPSSIMLAATYLYEGQPERGLELARRTVQTMVLDQRWSWCSALLFRGDNAGFLWGADYYQNLMLWCLPAAIAGTDLAGPCQPGGLVERMVRAGAG